VALLASVDTDGEVATVKGPPPGKALHRAVVGPLTGHFLRFWRGESQRAWLIFLEKVGAGLGKGEEMGGERSLVMAKVGEGKRPLPWGCWGR
jgi:hypothetical protein